MLLVYLPSDPGELISILHRLYMKYLLQNLRMNPRHPIALLSPKPSQTTISKPRNTKIAQNPPYSVPKLYHNEHITLHT